MSKQCLIRARARNGVAHAKEQGAREEGLQGRQGQRRHRVPLFYTPFSF